MRAVPLLAVAVVVLLAGGAMAAVQKGGGSGLSSPQGAVERLLEAVEDADLLGVLEALLPGERSSFREPVSDLASELRRLEILSSDLDLGGISGFEVSFDGLSYETDPVRDDLARVRIVGGTASYRVDPQRLPVGAFLRDVLGSELSAARPTSSTDEVDDGTPGIATVKHDGRWYVSLWYTVAEGARVEAGAPVPDLADRLQARGAASPEAAVQDMIRALAGFDLRRAIELLPPGEAQALHDYAPLFIDEIDAASESFAQEVVINIRDLRLEADRSGSRALVQIREAAVDAVVYPLGLTFSFDGECAEVGEIGSPFVDRTCLTDETGSDPFGALGGLFGVEPPNLDLDSPRFGFVAVEEDGLWYVSPTRTFFETFIAVLRIFDPEDLDELRRFFENVD